MSRAELRRSLRALGISERAVESLLAELPADAPAPRRVERAHQGEAEAATSRILAELRLLLSDEDARI